MQPFEQLEKDWAAYNDLDPAGMVACSSGTAALHLALEAMQLPQGSQVIVPDLTMIAVPRAVTMAGLTPVFVDCDDTLNMAMLNAMCHKDVKVIMAVHTYGKQCDTGLIHQAAYGNGAKVVEDLAEAHGLKVHYKTDAATWSFYSNKIVSGQEGGAVWFRNNDHAKLARQLRSLGFTDDHDFVHVPRGHNYRMSNAHASLILDSLKRVDLSLENRWLQWHTYHEICPQDWRMQKPDAPWVYAMRIKGMVTAKQDVVVRELKRHGIEARHCFKMCHTQEEYNHCKTVSSGNESSSQFGYKCVQLSNEVIYLPLSSYGTRCHLDAFNIIKRILDK